MDIKKAKQLIYFSPSSFVLMLDPRSGMEKKLGSGDKNSGSATQVLVIKILTYLLV